MDHEMSSALAALLASAVHTTAYCGHRAHRVSIYSKFGLAILRKAWLNLDAVWAAALVVTSVFTLLI